MRRRGQPALLSDQSLASDQQSGVANSLLHLAVATETNMVDVEWKPLPTPMWPEGSVMADLSGLILEASFDHGVPTWKVQRHNGKNALPTWSQAARLTASRPPRPQRCTLRNRRTARVAFHVGEASQSRWWPRSLATAVLVQLRDATRVASTSFSPTKKQCRKMLLLPTSAAVLIREAGVEPSPVIRPSPKALAHSRLPPDNVRLPPQLAACVLAEARIQPLPTLAC
jgi:hypothetical protein